MGSNYREQTPNNLPGVSITGRTRGACATAQRGMTTCLLPGCLRQAAPACWLAACMLAAGECNSSNGNGGAGLLDFDLKELQADLLRLRVADHDS